MNEFEQKVAEVVRNKLNDGTVEKLIEQKLEESIKKSLDDIFGYSGDGKKILESKLNEVMVPVIERHDFNQYLVKLDNEEIEVLKADVDKLEMYRKYDEMSGELKAINDSFVRSGFTEQQAFELMIHLLIEAYKKL